MLLSCIKGWNGSAGCLSLSLCYSSILRQVPAQDIKMATANPGPYIQGKNLSRQRKNLSPRCPSKRIITSHWFWMRLLLINQCGQGNATLGLTLVAWSVPGPEASPSQRCCSGGQGFPQRGASSVTSSRAAAWWPAKRTVANQQL